MAKFHTFGITSRTRGITQNVYIVRLGLNSWCTLSFTCLDNASKSVQLDISLLAKLLHISRDLTCSRVDDDQVLDHGCFS